MYFFETIKCENFEAFNLSYHEKRVADTISMNLNLQDYIYAPSDKLFRCKLVYNENSIIKVEYYPYKKKKIKSFKLIFDDEIDYSKKYLNRDALDNLYAQKEQFDEIIIVKNNKITDTSIASIAVFDGNIWSTPKEPLLEGTTRARLLEEGKIFEKHISVKMLKNAKKLALMSSMIGFDKIEGYSFF